MGIDKSTNITCIKYNSLKELVSNLARMAAEFHCNGHVYKIYSPSRGARLVKARMMLASVLRESLKCPYTTIADWLNRDHSTVTYWSKTFDVNKLTEDEKELYKKMKKVALLDNCAQVDYTYYDFIGDDKVLRDKDTFAWIILRRISDFYGIETHQLISAQGKNSKNAMLAKARAISYYILREYFAYTRRETRSIFGFRRVELRAIPEFSNIEKYFISDLQIYLHACEQRYKIFGWSQMPKPLLYPRAKQYKHPKMPRVGISCNTATRRAVATTNNCKKHETGARIDANKELLTIKDIDERINNLFKKEKRTELIFVVYVRYPGSTRFVLTSNYLTARTDSNNILYSASWSKTPPCTIDDIKHIIENTGPEGTVLRFKLEKK